MYKAVFQNSKVALLFAALTVVGAVRMVGSSEDGGVLVQVMDLAESARDDGAEVSVPAESGPDRGSAADPVFGEYDPQAQLAVSEPLPTPPPDGTDEESISDWADPTRPLR